MLEKDQKIEDQSFLLLSGLTELELGPEHFACNLEIHALLYLLRIKMIKLVLLGRLVIADHHHHGQQPRHHPSLAVGSMLVLHSRTLQLSSHSRPGNLSSFPNP